MNTFCAVDDTAIIRMIQGANKRIVYIAPGVHEKVAESLKQRSESVRIKVILDSDEDVYRIGYGDAVGLKILGDLAKSKREEDFELRYQHGLRVGVLLADEKILVWSPTPRSVEEPPSSIKTPSNDGSEESAPTAPNGLLLGANPIEQVAQAVDADGMKADPRQIEIGRSPITQEQVKETISALEKNPPIPVDLAIITRVFSTKLQFVEIKVKRAKFSKMQLKVPSKILNADVNAELRGLLEARLLAFADLRDEVVGVPSYMDGEPVCDTSGRQRTQNMTEALLERSRHEIARRFIYNIVDYGQLIAKDDKIDFERCINAYKIQLIEHSRVIRERLDQQAMRIIEQVVNLITERANRAAPGYQLPNINELRTELQSSLESIRNEEPEVSWVFKDVTFEQTKSFYFRERVDKALPEHKRKQWGDWDKHFKAAPETSQSQ